MGQGGLLDCGNVIVGVSQSIRLVNKDLGRSGETGLTRQSHGQASKRFFSQMSK